MASDDRDPMRHPPPNDDENPFIAFRRFTDEAVASMLQNLIGLPSAFERHTGQGGWLPFDERARRQMESWGAMPQEQGTWTKDGRRIEESWSGSPSKDDSTSRTTPASDGQLRCPYRPRQDDYRPAEGPRSRSDEEQKAASPLGLWLLRYLNSSPYSPSNLERRMDLGEVAWRDAFEDLVDAQVGKDLGAKRRHETDLSPFDWVRAVIERTDPAMLVRPQRELAWRAPESDQTEDVTELDMYERFLGLDLRKTMQQTTQEPKERTETGLGIISTLTTTERVSLPDGTTHTKMILKKRFADGREESSETVHTTNSCSGNEVPREKDKMVESAKKTGDTVAEKKGWFWS